MTMKLTQPRHYFQDISMNTFHIQRGIGYNRMNVQPLPSPSPPVELKRVGEHRFHHIFAIFVACATFLTVLLFTSGAFGHELGMFIQNNISITAHRPILLLIVTDSTYYNRKKPIRQYIRVCGNMKPHKPTVLLQISVEDIAADQYRVGSLPLSTYSHSQEISLYIIEPLYYLPLSCCRPCNIQSVWSLYECFPVTVK